jgi:hypothetical protein
MPRAGWLERSWCGFIALLGAILACGGIALAGTAVSPPQQPRISETDVPPHSRPLTRSYPLDEYVVRLQERLRNETRFIREPGLAEVKLTIRKDGALTFSEVVVLDGPAALRNDLLPVVHQLGPFPPPPVVHQLGPFPPPPMDADMLDVSVLLTLRYPGPDLLDSIDGER